MSNWYAIECSRGREEDASKHLLAIGVEEAWYPKEPYNNLTGARRRFLSKAGVPTKRPPDKAAITGWVFFYMDNPPVERIREAPGKLWVKLFCPYGVPYIFTDAEMAEMEQTPDRIAEIIEAARPKVGDRVRVTVGNMDGQTGEVEEVRGDNLVVSLAFGRARLAAQMVERVLPD